MGVYEKLTKPLLFVAVFNLLAVLTKLSLRALESLVRFTSKMVTLSQLRLRFLMLRQKDLPAVVIALLTTKQLLLLQVDSLKGVLDSEGDPSRFPPLPPVPDVSDITLQQQLSTARQQTQQIRSRLIQLTNQLKSRQQTLSLQINIADDMKPLFDVGAMARNQYLQQLNQVQIIKSEVASFEEERQKVLGEAAAQLNQINSQLINLDAELVALKETISYRTVRAPISGKVLTYLLLLHQLLMPIR